MEDFFTSTEPVFQSTPPAKGATAQKYEVPHE